VPPPPHSFTIEQNPDRAQKGQFVVPAGLVLRPCPGPHRGSELPFCLEENMNHKARAETCVKALEEKTRALSNTSSTVLDALMFLYQDVDKHADDYKYGRMDAGSAWRAVYNFMQFQDELARLERKLEDARWSVQAMSDGLYGKEEQ